MEIVVVKAYVEKSVLGGEVPKFGLLPNFWLFKTISFILKKIIIQFSTTVILDRVTKLDRKNMFHKIIKFLY